MRIITRDRSFYRSLFTLAVPIVLQNLISFAVNFADNLMVGRLGDTAVSAVYMGNQFQTVLQMFVFGIDAAMLIIAAQYWGLKDTKSVRKIAAMGIRWSVLVGFVISAAVVIFPRFLLGLLTSDAAVVEEGVSYCIFVALSYVFFCASQLMISAMKSVENAKLGFYVSLIALFVNIFLNWVLIFGKFGLPALGVKGAGIATLISRIVEFLIAAIYVFTMDRKLQMQPRDLLSSAPLLRKDFIRNGAPVVAGQMVWAVNMIAYSTIMGHLSPAAITASSIVAQMESLLRVGVFGLSAALGIVTSKTVGAGKFREMKEYATTAEVIFLGVGLLSSFIILVLKKPFVGFYDISDEAVNVTRQFFNVLNITFIGTCWQATCLGGLVKSGGDTGFVFKMDSIFVFGVLIPAGVTALLLGAPAWVVFLALKCDQILKCIVAFVKINSFNWMKKLTREDLAEE
ncbi:MAG: MATE family efflux transporter [Lachnospiraceae bacterium]|nr:MATE family efflux transporter [Lachnospiraceae bacterium]